MNKPAYLSELNHLCQNYEKYSDDESFFSYCEDSLLLSPISHPREERILSWHEHREEWMESSINYRCDLGIMCREYQCIYSREIYTRQCKQCGSVSHYYPEQVHCHACNGKGLLTLYSLGHHYCPTFFVFIQEQRNFLKLSLKIEFIK